MHTHTHAHTCTNTHARTHTHRGLTSDVPEIQVVRNCLVSGGNHCLTCCATLPPPPPPPLTLSSHSISSTFSVSHCVTMETASGSRGRGLLLSWGLERRERREGEEGGRENIIQAILQQYHSYCCQTAALMGTIANFTQHNHTHTHTHTVQDDRP